MNNEINKESGRKIREMHVLHGCKKEGKSKFSNAVKKEWKFAWQMLSICSTNAEYILIAPERIN